MLFDPLGDDDPLEDPFSDDPFEDPFDDDPIGGDGDDDLEDALEKTSPSTLLAFITAVVLVHVGLFGASLGAMLIGFRGRWTLGSALVIGGVFALVLAVVTYRRYRNRR